MDIMTIGLLYLAIMIVIALHEMGHRPEKIEFKLFPPTAIARRAKSRVGGLVVNVILFSLIFYLRPENILFMYVGAIAWAHFIMYAILGSILPEPKAGQVNTRTYVFDDVPNKQWYIFIPGGIAAFYYMQNYYLAIFNTLVG